MARVTLQTIADRLGVSRMTVSNAFSRPDQLSSDLRQRILSTAAELGYVGPDPSGRALARGSTGAVGVLLTDSLEYAFTDEVATGFLGAVVAGLAPTGLAVTLLTSNNAAEVIPARDVAIDGAIVYSCRAESSARDWLLRRRLPLVFVDQDTRPGIASVNIDDRGGARAAARHLVDLGHRRIDILSVAVDGPAGIVTDPLAVVEGHPQRQRMLGWLDVLDEAGIAPTIAQARHNSDEHARDMANMLLTTTPRPTAILCFSDVLAFGVLGVAADLGLDVPRDLSVVGFDDGPLTRRAMPGLTTVHQDIAMKGRLAAAELTKAIRRGPSSGRVRAHRRTLPTELQVRRTTARPRSSS
jgi:DNA-binding LacI/PurR family transcriptional regulator